MSGVDFGRYKRMVQAFWDPEPKNDDASGSCVWCLGKKYQSGPSVNSFEPSESKAGFPEAFRPPDEEISHERPGSFHKPTSTDRNFIAESGSASRESEAERRWPPEFLADCESRMWLTYRSNFPAIKKSSDASVTLSVRLRSLGDPGAFTSDTGWGCMIRSGQSLLANALVLLRLGRGIFPCSSGGFKSFDSNIDWRRGERPDEERELLSLFADDANAPFSIHRFVEHGASACGKHPGEWFGPSATARCIQLVAW